MFSLGKKSQLLLDRAKLSIQTCLHEWYLTEILDEFFLDSSVIYISLPCKFFCRAYIRRYSLTLEKLILPEKITASVGIGMQRVSNEKTLFGEGGKRNWDP